MGNDATRAAVVAGALISDPWGLSEVLQEASTAWKRATTPACSARSARDAAVARRSLLIQLHGKLLLLRGLVRCDPEVGGAAAPRALRALRARVGLFEDLAEPPRGR